MLCYIRFQQVVVADENYHHFPLIENSSYTDISKTDFFPLFFRTSGTYSEVILKDSERYHVGYTKRSSYTGCHILKNSCLTKGPKRAQQGEKSTIEKPSQ